MITIIWKLCIYLQNAKRWSTWHAASTLGSRMELSLVGRAWCPISKAVQFRSVQSLSLCDPMDRSTPGLPVHHQLPEFTQPHVHWVSDATQPSHSLLSPSPPAFNLSQHQGLFQWSSHQVAKVLEFQFSISPSNEYSGLISFRIDWLDLLLIKGLSRVFSNTTAQKHQFFSTQLSL